MGIDGTGALLIADDAGNTVWRVAAANGDVTPEPIGTDRVIATSAGETVSPNPMAAPDAAAPAPRTDAGDATEAPAGAPPEDAAPVTPPQTDIAPAVGPEDGGPQP